MARSKARTKPTGRFDWTIVEVFGLFAWSIQSTVGRKTTRIAGGTASTLDEAQAELDRAVGLVRIQGGVA